MTPQLANYWMAAARAGYVKPIDWQKWADKIIVAAPEPPKWIISMSLAKDEHELSRAIRDKIESEWTPQAKGNLDDAVIGYLWLRYKRHEMGLRDSLRMMGDRADESDSRVECEVFYDMLNRLEDSSAAHIEAEAAEVVAPAVKLATHQWDEITAAGGYSGATPDPAPDP